MLGATEGKPVRRVDLAANSEMPRCWLQRPAPIAASGFAKLEHMKEKKTNQKTGSSLRFHGLNTHHTYLHAYAYTAPAYKDARS